MVYLKRITPKVGDDATEQFMKMISEIVPKYKDKCLEFNKYEHHLDIFFHSFYLRNVMNHFGSFLFYYFVYFMERLQLNVASK